MNLPKVHIFSIIGLFLLPLFCFGQTSDVSVAYGKTSLGLNEKFTIKVVVRAKAYDVSDFPQIDGFVKGGRAVAHNIFRKNGVRGIEHTITQSYVPKRAGSFKLSPTNITVNERSVFLPGEIINVRGGQVATATEDSVEMIELPARYVEDAQLLLNTFKDSVFVGEGFRVTVGFYVSDLNTAGWDFPADLNAQVEAIAQKIKPENCLESRLPITNITSQRTRINQRGYTQYTLFEAVYYPLNTNPITFAPVSLSMKKIGDEDGSPESRKFATRPVRINVKPLPQHPLKDKVPVGNFYVREWLNKSSVETGTSVPYEFRVLGEGNFATLSLPTPRNDDKFDFYPSEVINDISEGKLSGSRVFKYAVFPKDTGTIALKPYFQLIYFNVNEATYDTLYSKVTIQVSGEKIASTVTKKNDIYAGIEKIDSTIVPINYRMALKNIANVAIVGMLISLLYMLRNRHTG